MEIDQGSPKMVILLDFDKKISNKLSKPAIT
jgi:hypothetical protein